MKRLFLAMHVAESTCELLLKTQAELRRFGGDAAAKIRPVHRQALHLTLKFFGDTADDQIPLLVAALTELAQTSAPVEATVAGVGAFPDPRRPRAVYAALTQGREQVVALATAIERFSVELGFTAETRPRVPHVTLARVDQAVPNGKLTHWIESHEKTPFGPALGHQVVLYESQLRPSGSVYSVIASAVLSGSTGR